MDDITVV